MDFYEWTDYFLVEEYVAGMTLVNYVKDEKNVIDIFSKAKKGHPNEIYHVLLEAMNTIESAHEDQIVLVDVQPSNFIVSSTSAGDFRVPFIDMEGSYDDTGKEYDRMTGTETKLFSDTNTRKKNDFETDWQKFAYICIHAFSSANYLLNYDDSGRSTINSFKNITSLLGVPVEIVNNIVNMLITGRVTDLNWPKQLKLKDPAIPSDVEILKLINTFKFNDPQGNEDFWIFNKYELSDVLSDAELSKLIENCINRAYVTDERISIYVEGEYMYCSPYIESGNAGLVNLILNKVEVTGTHEFDDLLKLLSKDLLVVSVKNITFYAGMSGMIYVLVKLYRYFQDEEYITAAKMLVTSFTYFKFNDSNTQDKGWLNGQFKRMDGSFRNGEKGVRLAITSLENALKERV